MLLFPNDTSPLKIILTRICWAVSLIIFVTLVAYLDRHGYKDVSGGVPNLLDCLYYATVSITTTGYGDIIPVSDTARLLTTLLITPARVIFLILLVGTTLEVLAGQLKYTWKHKRWERKMKNHIIICGFGVKGQSALNSLLDKGLDKDLILVIDENQTAVNEANSKGISAILGNASKSNILKEAHVENASKIIITPDRDDTAVLITLTARELNPEIIITAVVRETENAHLLRSSGADSVVVSAGTAGRMAAFGAEHPHLVEVLDDLLSLGTGLDLAEREVLTEEIGPLSQLQGRVPIVGVHRAGKVLQFHDQKCQMLEEGDKIIYLLPQIKK